MVSREIAELQKQLKSQKKEIDAQKKEVKELKKEEKALSRRLARRLKGHAGAYVLESRRALSTAILAAFAFLMALSWREYINEWVKSALEFSSVQGSLVSALFVTFIAVLGIIITTRFLRVKD